MRGTGPQSWQLDRRAAGDRATRTRARRLGRRLASRGGTLLLTAVMVVTVLPAQAWAIPGPGMSREAIEVDLPDIPDAERVGQDESAESDLTTADEVPVVPYEPQAVTPWESGDGTVDLTGVAAGETLPVDDLPVALGVPSDGDPADLAGSWAVGLAAPEASQAAGVAGLIMKITPPATADPAAEVALTVDYTTFADLYGPQAADRFGFLLLPECVYDAPDSGDCATADGSTGRSAGPQAGGAGITGTGEFTPAPSQVSVASTRRVVRGTVPVSALLAGEPAAGRATTSATSSSVVGVLDTGASAAGDYTATPLLSSGSWAAGSSSGAFTYGYQVQVPETSGGLMPQVNLSYSSQSVDGRTSATNNQASWIGDGWDYAAGSITRSYANCRQDSKKAGSNNASHRTGDLCWGSNNATLSLGGMTTELVLDDDEQTWITANGDGSKVQLLKDSGLANGDADGEYWVVTTRDGTRHWFGRHRLPGWSSGDPVTNSVLTAPVYGNHPGEPCYQVGNWAGSACTQAWRWSLDYVEDVHGNAMSLWWAKEINYYARNFNFKDPVRYDRGGYLTRIDYGQRADSVYSAAPLAGVSFTVAERCFAEGSLTCTEANFTSTDPSNYRIWYDTPADLHCTAGQKCWNASPAFFTRKRLDRITTSAQRQPGSTALQTVDEYRLKQSFPILRTGLNTALWLESVTRTGYGRSGNPDDKIALNAVRFEANPDDMPNRVRRDDRPNFSRLRIGRVINEYGGETIVTYKQPTGACDTGTGLPGKNDTAALKANTRLCYPSYWHPDPAVEDIDWFHKYVVDTVEELPAVDGAYPTVTRYSYADAGWKLTEQEFTKKSTRTYSRFAGFGQVTVITGDDDPAIGSRRSKSVTRYFRGLGDTVDVHDIDGVLIASDAEPFAGRIAEELTYTSADDADAAWLTRSITVPAATELARRDRDDGLSPLRAWRVTEPRQITYTRSSGTGDDTRTQRVVEARTTYETMYGLPTHVESRGDTGRPGDESCTYVDYLHRADQHVIGMTRQLRTSPTLCADADFDDLTTLSSASRVGYDGQPYGTALAASTRALVTGSWSLKADGSGFQSDGTVAFDAIGRVVSRTDPDGRTSTTTFEPATGQAYEVVERNSLGHEQTVEVDPGRGVAVRSTDPNGHVSQSTYDPLGRLVEVWAPGRTPTAGAVPDFSAEYHLPAGKPPYVVTRSRGHENRVETAVTLYDGLGRERQSQQEAVGGGRLISDTLYNTSGEVWQTNNAYYAEGAPSGGLFTPLADTAVPNATRYTYDGLGRVVTEMPVLRGTEAPERATRYEYGTDHSTVINPAGSPSYRTYSDAIGRTVRVDTFTDAARTEFTTMRYGYHPRGQLASATHSADPDRPWTWSYDQRGRLVTANDPDSGSTTLTYDHRDRPLTSTNARGVTVWNGYDELSRPTQQRLDGPGGTLLAEYGYDTAPGGIGLPAAATRYTDGLAYTQQVGGYTDDYQPTSTTLTLPQSVADMWGLAESYTYGYAYTDTGLPASVDLPAVGRMPAEQVLVRYTADGLPLSVSGQDWYGAETVYSPYGQVLRSTLGAQPHRVWTTASYDDASGALTDQRVFREQTGDQAIVGGNLVSHRSYGYDAAGNVTAIREHAAGIQERQCFGYDPLGQLTGAWTAADQTSCAVAPAAASVAAGPDGAGYWQEYSYDLLGNRSELVEKDLGGDTGKDATTTYGYGGADGSQPRTLTSVRKEYVTPAGAQVTAEAERLYEATGETRSVQSVPSGDVQELTWTYDGQVERIAGQGGGGGTAYVGVVGKCLDLQAGFAVAGQQVQLYECNGTTAQRWSFTVVDGQPDADLGTLRVYDDWCVQPDGDTAGSAVQLRACDGTAAQRLTRTVVGQLRHTGSGLCLAVDGGATVNSTPVVLAVCDAAATGQVWSAQDETRHVYGPDGARLLTVQDRRATLHLADAVVTVAAGGVNVNSQRSYAVPGGGMLRYAYGSASVQLAAVAADHQGSPYAEVGSTLAGMPVRILKRDPFGNPRAVDVLATNLKTRAGFLGAVPDEASGYTPLGARLYDPVVGRFLSADPVLDVADPLQSNGYAYAHNNPVTHADPSGLSISLTASERAAALAGAGLSTAQVAQARSAAGRSMTSVILSVAWDVLKEFIGLNAALGCFGGDVWSCVDLVTEFVPAFKLFKAFGRIVKAVERTFSAIRAWQKAKTAAQAVLRAARAAETVALNAKKAAAERAKRAAQALAKKAADKANTTSNKAVNASKKTGNPVQKQAQAKTNPKASTSSGGGGRTSAGGGSGKASSKPGGNTGASTRSNGGTSGGGDKPADSCPLNNSFTPGTKVLMADGTTTPIEDVKPGDKVIATDPETGTTSVETVTATITGDGVKHLVKITIDTDGQHGPETAQVTATDGHPFWVPELDQWTDATDLQPGQWLHTSTGTWIQITAIHRRTVPRAVVHNLTISHVHTYHVLAGDTPVLTHNCGDEGPPEDESEWFFRGVDENHRSYNAQHGGTVTPMGGHSDPVLHNDNNTESIYTSWTSSRTTAERHARNLSGRGVVLMVRRGTTGPIIDMAFMGMDKWGESEVLIQGVVKVQKHYHVR
ncbi:ricin-type beta-trefoil lectin domain protein [Solwaraspora sp. WMMA2080]|uniref:ricin-type beta-trefoil lectin domain protein n=1 Tax=unclassified Solwaraspora TaxID=2627926 RepID=UPI00248BEFD3|nr:MULTISPECIES: ricin-type beta-trefoil lectin domain protein [unclassified Solwaraspora]WBB96082.1 ricin-type beta-trefoil lectin domain protein [Solwaraspora sp. WMMA2059]WBC20013.1 ricin-type beta-trefoil lectin domain protein [Solwaraspora sp. WMMA2080]